LARRVGVLDITNLLLERVISFEYTIQFCIGLSLVETAESSTGSPQPASRSPGRPRDPRVDRSILEAALELLADGGLEALTIEAVAARAGVARTTVYRRWRAKDELVLAVLDDVAARLMPAPNLGDTRADLVAVVDTAVRVLTSTTIGRLMAALVSELPRNAELAQAFRRHLVDVRRRELRAVLDRGLARGELRAGVDTDAVPDLLIGPVYYRVLLAGQRPGRGYAEQVVDAFLRGAARAE
jgi:AcrR family transcriptional regulator